jgi:hypothetical protein
MTDLTGAASRCAFLFYCNPTPRPHSRLILLTREIARTGMSFNNWRSSFPVCAFFVAICSRRRTLGSLFAKLLGRRNRLSPTASQGSDRNAWRRSSFGLRLFILELSPFRALRSCDSGCGAMWG